MGFINKIFGNSRKGHHGGGRTSSSHHGSRNYYDEPQYANQSQGLRCSQCQTLNVPGSRFCSQCGNSVQNTMCSCGTLIAAGDKFCAQCGKSI